MAVDLPPDIADFLYRIAGNRKKAIAKEMESEGKGQKLSKEERDDK